MFDVLDALVSAFQLVPDFLEVKGDGADVREDLWAAGVGSVVGAGAATGSLGFGWGVLGLLLELEEF